MCDVFVAGLRWTATEQDIRRFFGACGTIVRISQPVNDNGRTKGLAYITFSGPEEASEAIKYNGKLMGKRWLRIEQVVSRKRRHAASSDAVKGTIC